MTKRWPVRIGALVLAAGGSTRLGRPKQLVVCRGRTLLRNAVEATLGAGCRPVVVVVGAHADAVRAQLADLRVQIVENPAWPEGLSGSVRCGLVGIEPSIESLDALMLTPCDQPFLSPVLFRRLIRAWLREADHTRRTMAACEYGGTVGTPALFARVEFPRLAGLHGDRGAQALLLASPERVVRVRWAQGVHDVDRSTDLTCP